MADSWTWDETLYAGSAPHYVAGRMPYPDRLGERIAQELALTGSERAIDVGCGPGPLTLVLAPHVAEIVGIDADAEMIEQATELGRRRGIENVGWRHMRGEDLPADLGPIDVATFAQSFHWMQRLEVATTIRSMLAPGGSCVHVGATTHRGDWSLDRLARPRPPYAEIEALVATYLGPTRRAGRSLLGGGTLSDEASVFREAGFDGPRRIEIPRGEIVERTVDEVVSATFSLSSSTPHLFGARRPDFERDLRTLLARSASGGRFHERVRDITVDLWR